MQSTEEQRWLAPGLARMALRESIEQELAALSAHLNAATARLLELAVEFRRQGGADWDDFGCWLAFRCGITVREARELVRVAEALQALPVTRAAFERGELSLTKLRALTRVANPRNEAGLVELAAALTASQLERALRAYRRVSLQQADATHELSTSTTTGKKTGAWSYARGWQLRTAPCSSGRSTPPANASGSAHEPSGAVLTAPDPRRGVAQIRCPRSRRTAHRAWRRSSNSPQPARWRLRTPTTGPHRSGHSCSCMSTRAF
jgi:hypothetical protein